MDSFIALVKSDLLRLDTVSIGSFLRHYFIPRGGTFPYVFWLRVVHCARRHWLSKWTFGMLAYPILRHYEFKYGIHANPNIVIGGGLLVVHGGSVHLNCRKIGKNLTVYHCVTFGVQDGGLPCVGDNVTVYPNSVIVGDVSLGNEAIVGALSYVAHDVPTKCLVVGSPARVIRDLDKKKGMLNADTSCN